MEQTRLDAAARLLRDGKVVAYPTEAVYALGCDPRDADAVDAIYDLKQRERGQGFLLIAADVAQLAPYVDWHALPRSSRTRIEDSWPGPNTWVVPRTAATPGWLVGSHEGIAVRVTAHPTAAALCRAFGAPVVSTSANPHGSPPAQSAEQVARYFGPRVSAIVEAPLGQLARPTAIRDAITGAVLRA